MKTNKELFVVRKLTLAVQGSLVAMLAMPMVVLADDYNVETLTHPTNTVEIGAENVSKDSAKFGEYNGLNKSGGYLNGNFSVRGGDAYKAFEGGDGIYRWEFKGTDIGTTSREVSGSVSNQGQWDFGLKYNELQHNISNTYQTPLVGSMGGNSFTLPSNFGYINTSNFGTTDNTSTPRVPLAPNGFVPKGTQILAPSQLGDFNTQDVHTDRKNTSFSAGYHIDRQWGVKFDFNHLEQSGAKLISIGTDGTTTGAGPSSSNAKAEGIMLLMNPTNYKTDTFNFAINWAGEKSYATASYFGSLFTDNYNGLSVVNPFISGGSLPSTLATGQPNSQIISALAYPVDMLSTMPSNAFHQFNLNGGYTLSPSTKLVGGLSYGRNTQNDSYMSGAIMQIGGLPQNSLDGLVVTKHADLKLTNQTTKDLFLTAGLKYNERDNQTASNIYQWFDLNPLAESAVNIPMSNKKTQLELAGDYRIDQKNRVHLGYEQETIKRWCNNALANNAQSLMTAGTIASQGTIPTGYAASSCVQVSENIENKVVLGYKLQKSENLNFNAGYSYATRSATVNSTFYNPLHANSEGYENVGYVAFFDASRTEELLKAGVNWQANDKLSLSLNGRYISDVYPKSALGVQGGLTTSANLDATYSYSENNVVSTYLTWQEKQRQFMNTSSGRPPTVVVATKIYNNNEDDNSITVGLAGKQKGLMGGKLEINEDLTYSIARTQYSTGATPAAVATCGAATSLTCGNVPTIQNETVRLKLTGNYQVNKTGKVAVGYTFQKLNSQDYYYNAYQYGYTSTALLPTNEQAPNYTVNVIAASYIYSF